MAQARTKTLEKRQIQSALKAIGKGQKKVSLPGDLPGIDGEIVEALRAVITTSRDLNTAIKTAAKTVGRDGVTGYRLDVEEREGLWADNINLLNQMTGGGVTITSSPLLDIASTFGANATVLKPFTNSQLLKKIKLLLES